MDQKDVDLLYEKLESALVQIWLIPQSVEASARVHSATNLINEGLAILPKARHDIFRKTLGQ